MPDNEPSPLSEKQQTAVTTGLSVGRIAGRTIAVAMVFYAVSRVYRSGSESIALSLGVLVGVYALVSVGRGLAYGYLPWDPVEWVPTSPDELDPGARTRATRWTVTLKLLLTVGSLGTLAAVYSAGLGQLGYLLLLGGLPAWFVQLHKHYTRGTRPWYPSVPREPEIER